MLWNVCLLSIKHTRFALAHTNRLKKINPSNSNLVLCILCSVFPCVVAKLSYFPWGWGGEGVQLTGVHAGSNTSSTHDSTVHHCFDAPEMLPPYIIWARRIQNQHQRMYFPWQVWCAVWHGLKHDVLKVQHIGICKNKHRQHTTWRLVLLWAWIHICWTFFFFCKAWLCC